MMNPTAVKPAGDRHRSDGLGVHSEVAPVALFVLSTCPVCNTLKRLLDKHGVEYDAIEVDLLSGDEKQTAMDDLKRHNRMMSFPTLVAGHTVIAGYQKDKILKLFNIQPPSIFSRFKRGLALFKRQRIAGDSDPAKPY